jgi:hypothetical protein
MRDLSEDLIRLRINELAFVRVTEDEHIKIFNYLSKLPTDTIYQLEKHTENKKGAMKILKFLKQKIGG